MRFNTYLLALLSFQAFSASWSRGQDPKNARMVEFHGYKQAVELRHGDYRAVLCPESGGRVLEFSLGGKTAMQLDEDDGKQPPGRPGPASAGRFDFGPEMTTPPHQVIWSGAWTAELTGPRSARLVSQHDERSGVQLIRDFELQEASTAPVVAAAGKSQVKLACKQTIKNVSSEVREYCHWGRSFSPGGGICLIPLSGNSRFPGKYAMYEEGTTINVKVTDDQIRERDGFLEILAPPRKPKLGFDSYAGWLAYLLPDNFLFVKRFATFPDRVYNEAAGLTISVWYPPGPRIELEPIGPRERLKPGESASFTEDWWLLPYPFPKKGQSIDLGHLRQFVAEHTGGLK